MKRLISILPGVAAIGLLIAATETKLTPQVRVLEIHGHGDQILDISTNLVLTIHSGTINGGAIVDLKPALFSVGIVPTSFAWVLATNIIPPDVDPSFRRGPNDNRNLELHQVVSNLVLTTTLVIDGVTNVHQGIVKVIPLSKRVREVRFEVKKTYTDER